MAKDNVRGIIDPSGWMRQEEVAVGLHVSVRTVQRLRAKGELKGMVGPDGKVYYHPREVRAWADARWAAS